MKNPIQKALAAVLAACMLLTLLPMAVLAVDEVTHSHDGWVTVTMGTTHIKLGEEEQTSNTLPTGSYYLDGDISVPLTVTGEVNLCLNGHSVTVSSDSAITINSGATLNICDCVTNSAGKIVSTSGASYVAGIKNEGTLTLHSGAVEGASWGVYNHTGGNFTMTGGTVTGKDASSSYGVYNSTATSVFKLSGGAVSGGKYGIYNRYLGSKVYLSGAPSITGTAADIYTDEASSLIYADDGAESGAVAYSGKILSLRYSSHNSGYNAVHHVTEDTKGKFTLTNTNYILEFNETTKTLLIQNKPATPAHTHNLSVGCSATEGDQVEFTEWKSGDFSGAFPSAPGNYVLAEDVTIRTETWTISSGVVNLCLNGHTLNMTNGGYILLNGSDAKLNICDCSEHGSGSIKSVSSSLHAEAISITHSKSTLNLYGGNIHAEFNGTGTAGSYAYGVNTSAAPVNIYGGTVTAKSSASKAIALNVTSSGPKVSISGGVLTAQAPEGQDAYGLYGLHVDSQLSDTYSISISGGVFIAEKSIGLKATPEGRPINATGGIFSTDPTGVIAPSYTARKIKTTDAGYQAEYAGYYILEPASAHPAHKHAVSVGCEADSGTQVEFTAWSTADAMPDTAGNYYLTCDVEMTTAWNVPAGTTNLCLNGHVLSHTGSSYVINLQNGPTLNLCDCQTTAHKFTANEYGNWSLDPNGDKTVSGGVITSCKSPYTSPIGINIRGGSLTMYGGNIVGNTQGVCLSYFGSNLGSFTMEGGSIQGNYGADGGAGVKISGEPTTTFTMKGGAIANTTAYGGDGGGVCLMKGVFNLEGGAIANNRSLSTSSMGGGVRVSMNGTFNMTGGSITGNSATHGGGIYMNGDAKVTLSGGSITGNQAGYQQLGGGIYYDGAYVNSGYLRLKGAPVIQDNARGWGEAASDIYLAGGAVMTVGANNAVLAKPAKPIVIGASGADQAVKTVTSDWGNRMYSGEEYKNYANYFKSDSSDYALGLETTHYELTLGPSQVTPATYTVTFNANGHGTAPASITNVTAGSKVTAPTPPTTQGWTFGGWYQEAACTTPWVFETNTVTDNVTLYAKWTEVPSNPAYDISGTVTDNGAAVADAAVKLVKGREVVQESATDENGAYTFADVAPGDYNVVAAKDGKTMTILITVETTDLTEQNLAMPADSVNSVLDVRENTPAVVVGGLEAEAASHTETGKTVTVTMTVESKAETDSAAAADIAKIKETASGKTLSFLAVTVEKQVDEEAAQPVSETSRLLTIIIPFDKTGKKDITVYRCHGETAEALPTAANADGEYFVVGSDAVTVYAKKFSTYAIGYTKQVNRPSRPSTSTSTKPALPFTDVKTTDEWYESVKYGYENTLMEGTSATTFDPTGALTRAMLATVLYRAAGSPAVEGDPEFEDAEAGMWYSDAVIWASQAHVLRGYGNGKFGPNDPVSREMLNLVIARQNGEDPAWVGDAELAVPAARSEVAVMLMRYRQGQQ